MDEFAFEEGLFEEEGETKQERRLQRITERKQEAVGYEARIDTPERLDTEPDYVAEWLLKQSGDVPHHELRRLEAICSRLYCKGRYEDCLLSVIALIRWHTSQQQKIQMSEVESLATSDEQLADLAMRASLHVQSPGAIETGVGIAAATQHLWHVWAGLALSASRCFERNDDHLEAAKALGAYLLIRGVNKNVANDLLRLVSYLFRSDLPDGSQADMPLPDVQALARLLELDSQKAEKLHGQITRSSQLTHGATRREEDDAVGGGRHDRSVRSL